MNTQQILPKHQSGNKLQQMLGADDKTFQEFGIFLVQKAKAQGVKDEDLDSFIQSLGFEGIKKIYNEFINSKQQNVPMNKKGSKLNYIKHLKGICPEGYEIEYYKNGGNLCTKCKKKTITDVDGTLGYKPLAGKGTKLVQEFKAGKKCKKKK